MGETFEYVIVTKQGQARKALGTATTTDKLAYGNILKAKTGDGIGLYRVDDIKISEGRAGITRTATVKALISPADVVVTGTLEPTNTPELAAA